MSGHTPGEWIIAPHAEDEECLQIVANYEVRPGGIESASWIAECDLQENPEENEANACLIAAAPLLLNALEDLVDIIRAAGLLQLSNGVELGATSWYVKACDRLRCAETAIAKAEGR